MDIALCTANGKSYDIATFSTLDSRSLDRLRRALVCKKCNGKGYYRKKSRDGKHACFGAYHEDNCKYKSKVSAPRYTPETIEEVNTIITNNETIDVNFTTYTAKQFEPVTGSKPSPSRRPSSTNSQQHTGQPTLIRNATKGLRSLLRMLMQSDSFATSDIEINTGAKHPFKAKNLFVNFDDISEDYVGKWRGYWGVISHTDLDINWLNTANEQNVSIPIGGLKQYIIDVFNIETTCLTLRPMKI